MENINDKNFNEKAINPNKEFVLVFSSTNCPHCVTVESFLKKLEQDKEIVGETNIFIAKAKDSNKLIEKYGIRAFPTTFFFGSDMKNKHTILGATSVEDFTYGFKKIKKEEVKENKSWVKNFLEKFK